MIYNLIIDEKVKVWKRLHVNVEAENIEEAVKKCIGNEYEQTNQEYLFETETQLNPIDEEGTTKEIYEIGAYSPTYTNYSL